ncbi:MAG: hypothetical protein J6X18_12700 [Bacteroidales bacterium]|nr:hypothetical protein [Bacteroidales bacterium]
MAEHKNPTKQRKPSVGRGGVPTPEGFEKYPERRHNGAWKKEDTLRYKWEKMLTMNEEELFAVLDDPKASKVERTTAEVLLDVDMKPLDKLSMLTQLANQVYGLPKQINENRNIELKPILPMEDK